MIEKILFDAWGFYNLLNTATFQFQNNKFRKIGVFDYRGVRMVRLNPRFRYINDNE